MGEWTDKTVLVTGAASGMGRAVAKRFLHEGASVVAADVDGSLLENAGEELRSMGGSLHLVVGDIASVEDCKRIVRTAVAHTGRLDVVVNSAGVWLEGPSEEITEAQWDRTIDINLKGTFFISSTAIPELKKSEGSIVNISSNSAVFGESTAAVYSASKGGVNMLTKSMALELAPHGVRVNAICPGDVMTPMLEGQARDYGDGDPEGYLANLRGLFPQGSRSRFIQPDEIAEVAYVLASPRMTPVTGVCITVDFGTTAGFF